MLSSFAVRLGQVRDFLADRVMACKDRAGGAGLAWAWYGM